MKEGAHAEGGVDNDAAAGHHGGHGVLRHRAALAWPAVRAQTHPADLGSAKAHRPEVESKGVGKGQVHRVAPISSLKSEPTAQIVLILFSTPSR